MIDLFLGEWGVEDLWAGPDQLPEEDSSDPWLGWPLQQGQGTHQQRGCHETVSLLQGKWSKLNLLCSFGQYGTHRPYAYMFYESGKAYHDCTHAHTHWILCHSRSLRMMLLPGRTSWTGSMPCLMCGLMSRDAGCTWKVSSLAVLTSSTCCLWRPHASRGRGRLPDWNWVKYGLVIRISSVISSL